MHTHRYRMQLKEREKKKRIYLFLVTFGTFISPPQACTVWVGACLSCTQQSLQREWKKCEQCESSGSTSYFTLIRLRVYCVDVCVCVEHDNVSTAHSIAFMSKGREFSETVSSQLDKGTTMREKERVKRARKDKNAIRYMVKYFDCVRGGERKREKKILKE